MTPKDILAENYEAIEGICRRLPIGVGLLWVADSWTYESAAFLRKLAKEKGMAKQLEEAAAKKQRGQRLVVIVTVSETLYQFV